MKIESRQVVHSQHVLVCFVSSARLGKVDVDANSFTTEELKKALAKMKESEKAERKVSFSVSKAMHGAGM